MITFQMLLENLGIHAGIRKFRHATSHIKAVDNRDDSWMNTLRSLMEDYNWKPMGKGKYGAVFGKEGYPYIIKVFMKDAAYLKWLDFCKQHQNNPYLPAIKGKAIKIGSHILAVRLEKLAEGGDVGDIYKEAASGNQDAKVVVSYLKKHNSLLDLHAGNVMKRGRQLVITDPLYNWYKGHDKNSGFTIDPEDVSEFKHIL